MKFKQLLLSSAIGLSLSAPSAMAQMTTTQQTGQPSFNYIEASYLELDELDTTFDGMELELTGQVAQNIFVSANYANTSGNWADFGSSDFERVLARAGFIIGPPSEVALYVGPQLQYLSTDYNFSPVDGLEPGSQSETDWGVFGGGRMMITNNAELNAEISWVDVDYSDFTTFSVGARWFFTDNFAANGKLNFGDLDGFNLGVSYHF